ncbi:MAG: nitroreductase family deazaflavin-dependent oxidoreductase [Dehalococcoidia bacterium]|nr:nitroreductase family deazaflavin-dependent oxidoreductase [Dehalococcoidia bacterium]
MSLEPVLGDADYCYLTTTGRVSGEPHTIEIWFALLGGSAYVLAGGRERSDWVKNARANSSVRLRIGDRQRGPVFDARARTDVGGDEEARARQAVAGKYRARGHDGLDEWEREALVVAIDLQR